MNHTESGAVDTTIENPNAGLEDLAKELLEADVNDSDPAEAETETETDLTDETAPEVDETDETDPATETETKPEEGDAATQAVTKAQAQAQKDAQAFAAMRVQNAELQRTLELAAKSAGQTVEEYIEAAKQKELETEAKAQQIPTQVLARIRELEERDALREQEHQNILFKSQIESFQKTHNLDSDALKDFVSQCLAKGIDLSSGKADLDLLYKGFNHEALIEAERQKWILKGNRNLDSSSQPGKPGKPESAQKGKIETMEDFEALFG